MAALPIAKLMPSHVAPEGKAAQGAPGEAAGDAAFSDHLSRAKAGTATESAASTPVTGKFRPDNTKSVKSKAPDAQNGSPTTVVTAALIPAPIDVPLPPSAPAPAAASSPAPPSLPAAAPPNPDLSLPLAKPPLPGPIAKTPPNALEATAASTASAPPAPPPTALSVQSAPPAIPQPPVPLSNPQVNRALSETALPAATLPAAAHSAPPPAPNAAAAAPPSAQTPAGNSGGNANSGNTNAGGGNHNQGSPGDNAKPPAPAPVAAQPASPTPMAAHQANAPAPATSTASSPPPATPQALPAHPANAAGMASWQAASASNALQAAPGREMRVTMQSDALGSVQLHATLHDNVLGATIAVDRPEVHNFLAAQMPSLERTLESRQLQVGSLNLQQQGSGLGQGGAGSQSGTPQQSTSNSPSLPFRSGPDSSLPALTPSPTAVVLPPGRLNLHA